ncbi:MAG: hypothetical protein RLZZ347_785 [Candidatus Parcubacteria bacterium]|jgi:glycosyltransferase involved in cell wall biosynthesis
MKKILIFSLAYYPNFVGGAEVAVKEITDRLGGDFEFHMVTLGAEVDAQEEKVGNVFVHRVGVVSAFSKLLFPFTACKKALELHRKNQFDTVWSIMASRAGFATLFFKLLNPKVPFLLTLQEGDTKEYPGQRMGILRPFVYPLFKLIFKRADRITAISNYLAQWAREMGVIAPVSVIPNGVDVDKFSISNFQFSNGGREGMREKFGFSESDTVLVTTSRLVVKNGVGDVIDALRFLPENVKFLVVGSGPLEKALKASVEAYKLDKRVVFVGFVEHANLPPHLHMSDIFIRPSLSEGMGNSFIEAMTSGLPVIATPVGGIPDFLTDRETGIFCEPHDPKSIADAVTTLLFGPQLRATIIENAQKMVVEKYDWNLVAEEMKGILKV